MGRNSEQGEYWTAAQLAFDRATRRSEESIRSLADSRFALVSLFLLALLLLARFLLRLVISEADGDGCAHERQGKHQSHQFLHAFLLWDPTNCSSEDNDTQMDMNPLLRAN